MEDGDRFLIFTGSRFGAASGGKRSEERIKKAVQNGGGGPGRAVVFWLGVEVEDETKIKKTKGGGEEEGSIIVTRNEAPLTFFYPSHSPLRAP